MGYGGLLMIEEKNMHQETNAKDDTQKKIFTIPNLMSLFRLCLIPVIIWLYCVEKNDVAAGLVLAFTNGVLKKECREQNSLFAVIPAVFVLHPFTTRIFGQTAGLIVTILVPAALFLSVKQTLKFSRVSRAYRGLPVDMLSAGIIYMILSIY